MSAEVGLVFVVPALLAGVLFSGAARLTDAAGSALAERQRRAREAGDQLADATDGYDLLRRRIDRERARFGDRITALPALTAPSVGGDLARAAEVSAAIRARTTEAERRFHEEITAARTDRIMADVAAAIARIEAATPPAGPGGPTRPAAARRELAESLRRVLGRLDTAAPPEVAARFERRAADALAVPSAATALRLLDDLRYTIDRANLDLAARRVRLAELSRRLAHHAGTAVEEARARIAAAADEPDPDLPGLERLVDTAVAAAVAAAEQAAAQALAEAVPAMRAYATRALRESLEEIGCAVEPDFDVVLVRDGMAHVQRPGWEDLAVRVRTHPRDNTMYFNLVTPRDGAETDLAAAEHQWCGTVDALLPALAERGVEVTLTHRSVEGDPEAQRVDPARYPFDRARRARRRGDQQRERGR